MTTKVSIGLGGTGANSAASMLSSVGAVAKSGDTMTGQLNISSGGLLVTGTANVSANVAVGAGSQTAPSLTRSGDTDTGIYFPAANEMAITAGGTVAQAFNSDGVFFRNRIINGEMSVAQRGTSVAVGTSPTYFVDRFAGMYSVSVTGTLSQQSSGRTDFLYCARAQRTSGQTATGNMSILQVLENNNCFGLINSPVTFSFYARAGSNYSASSNTLSFAVYTGTGTDQSSSSLMAGSWTTQTAIINSTATLTTSWQKFTATATSAATARQFAILFQGSLTGTAGTNDYFEVTGVQLETGSVATPFERRPYGTELMLCQRYFTRFNGSALDRPWCVSAIYDSTTAYGVIPLPVTMRADPTITFSGSTVLRLLALGTGFSASASSAGNVTPQAFEVYGTYSGLTQGGSWMRASGASQWIAASAEL